MAIPRSRRSAKQLVEHIAYDHGYLGEEKLQRIEPDLRRDIEEAFLKKDLMIGSDVITLAKNLYTSKARFVFELLQNADDNSYTRAAASGSVPYVSFRVYPQRIVLECNEDGFTDENLIAICSVGKSSKTGARGYIGEKGIGFKSVFMAAWKVHIQSNYFSISFSHKSGESGMGMISPIWENTDEELESPLTRITLHLHETGDAVVRAKTREVIQQQFEELQETILLFLKNLRKVHISFYDTDIGEQASSTAFLIERPRTNYAVLKTTKHTGVTTQEHVKYFHVTTYEATNLAKNENRHYSEVEEATRAYSKSQVILAFPLSERMVPIIELQDLYVFLPVRQVGFNFLIQADFVTEASRQDIVKDSLRNIDLLDGIANAFVKAVLQFCEHDTLRYQWMRYLPDRYGTNWGSLWISLINKISDCLIRTPVLYGRKRSDRRLISDLFRLSPNTVDENGEPLFDDGDPEEIISRRYDASDLSILGNYGLHYASFTEIIKWLREDLKRNKLSRMKSPETPDSWHTRVAKLLRQPFAANLPNRIQQLKQMHLLPLEDGSWVSASFRLVYFAQVDGIDIPSDIDLRLISKSVTNAHRLTLFKDLGVQTASVDLVRREILRRYSKGRDPSYISLENSKCHLKFLYLTEHLKADDEPSYFELTVWDTKGKVHLPSSQYMYIANDEPYGPWELFKKTDAGPNPGDGAPGYGATFVNEEYFRDSPAKPPRRDWSWTEWFYYRLDVERYVHLKHNRAQYYLQEHRPEKFLGSLCMWHQHSGRFSSDHIDRLQRTEVLCRGNRRVLLKNAYFPTEALERRVGRFLDRGAFFPWLWLDGETTNDTILPEWKSLFIALGVGSPSTDLDFALDMLNYSIDWLQTTVTSTSRERLFKLYSHIQSNQREDDNPDRAKKKIRDTFFKRKSIYIPRTGNECTWAFPNECVWSAPQEMKTKFVLQRLYEPGFRLDAADKSLEYFFTDILKITNCNGEIYVNELKALKDSGCNNSDTITVVYRSMDGLRFIMDAISKDYVKSAFENEGLIYAPSDDGPAWHRVSQCVWSRAARLRGKVSLNDDYEDLEELFVDFLGVKLVDLPMAIDELKDSGVRESTSVAEVKESIWTVNALLSTEGNHPSSREIVKGRIFPVRYPNGTVTRGSMRTEFCIVDREPLRRSFETKVKFLDFTLEEVVQLRPFFEWVRLEDRCLSHCVKEITSFHGGLARPTSNPDRQIRNRAHALLRVAAHFTSPRLRSTRGMEAFYEVLRNAEIYETDRISLDLVISQDGTAHEVEGRKTTMHIDEDQSGLKIYLPRNKDDQGYMFTNSLSQRLFEWMMRHPVTQIPENISEHGVKAIRDILLAPRSRIRTCLDDNGIAAVSVQNLDEEVESEPPSTPDRGSEDGPEFSTSSDQAHSEQEILDTPTSSVLSPPLDRPRAAASGRDSSLTPSRYRHALRDPVASPTPSPTFVSATPAHVATSDQQYVDLLDMVIMAARRSSLPSYGAFSMSQLQAGLFSEDPATHLGGRFASQIERDCKIGAAGELYVFELLTYLFTPRQLPGFSVNNWQSTVRRYVTVHREYADMEPWRGQETSDIVYVDSEGVLTGLLVEKGYLDREIWAGKTPKYFIEVKTTTMSCETPFYMSKAQYQRMKDNVITTENRDTIYVIFRVYYLGRPGMGLKVYIDPETLRLSDQLEFTAETWSVVPTIGA